MSPKSNPEFAPTATEPNLILNVFVYDVSTVALVPNTMPICTYMINLVTFKLARIKIIEVKVKVERMANLS